MKILQVTGGAYYATATKNSFSTNQIQQPKYNNNRLPQVSFGTAMPVEISYFHPICKIQTQLKSFGIKPFLIFDAAEKNLLLGKRVKACVDKIKDIGLEIPKMEIHLDNWNEIDAKRSTAAITDIYHDSKKNKTDISMSFNTQLYKNQKDPEHIFRLKKSPSDTSFDADFFHEFAHAYQGFFNNDNYNKLLHEKIPQELTQEVSQKVSKYATANKAEFVAEYFSFKLMGHDIGSQKLEKLYNDCLGPDLSKLNKN